MAESRARILVIEDDPDIAAVEQQFLVRAGYQTKLAATGRDGLSELVAFKPDVVLLDIGLPDMSGLDACTTIAETADAYILFVSGNSSEDVALQALGSGSRRLHQQAVLGQRTGRANRIVSAPA